MNPWNLDSPLLRLSPVDVLTLGQAFQGILVLGATGCGKSTGSLYSLAMAFLMAGFGGLVLAVKPDEAAIWRRYAAEAGRENDLIVVSPGGPFKLNAMKYECERPGPGARETESLYRLLNCLSELGERGQGGTQNESYWRNAQGQMLKHTIEVCKAAYGTVSIDTIHEIIRTAAQSPADLESDRWREQSFCLRSILLAEEKTLPLEQRKDFEYAASYFIGELPFMADRTRSSIVTGITGTTDIFMRGAIRELFCSDTTFIPEMTFMQGRIVLLSLDVKSWGATGRIAQALCKLIFQRAFERRDVRQYPRPCFIFADEGQEFVTSEDRTFQATARSARVASVLGSQSLPSLYAALGGGDAARQEADALLSNFQTKVFHANADSITNEWASNMIAKSWQYRATVGSSSPAPQEYRSLMHSLGPQGTNASVSEQLDFDVPPQTFTQLQMGGAPEFVSEAVVFRPGRSWNLTGKNHLRVLFPQGINP